MKKQPKLVNFTVIGKFTDGKYRQFVLDGWKQSCILGRIQALEPDNVAKVMEIPIKGISWESDVDLNKPQYPKQ